MTDDVFAEYQKYGINSRSQMIKPKEEVDALTPNWGERNEDDWVVLSASSSTRTKMFQARFVISIIELPKSQRHLRRVYSVNNEHIKKL